jgi:Peptidase M50B-like
MLSTIGRIDTPLPAPDAVVIGLLALIVVYGGTLWKVANHAETVVHESAHALTGIATGRRISGVNIDKDGGGGTVMMPDSGFGFGVAAFAGYIGPSAAGLIAAGLISGGRIVAVLWLGLLLFVFMLLLVRNFFGGIVILTSGALLYLVMRFTTAGVQVAVAYGVAWFLLFSGIKVAFGAASRPNDVADAGILAGMTFLWRSAWCFLWLVGSIAALAVGAIILTHA